MIEIWFLLILAAAGYLWHLNSRSQVIAKSAARRECERHGLQLLDQTVHRSRTSLGKDATGHWHISREYRFEYSIQGTERLQGKLFLQGFRVVSIQIDTVSTTIIH